METFFELLIVLVSAIIDHVSIFFGSLSDACTLSVAGSSVNLAFAAGALGIVPEGVLAAVKRWHGSIDDQFGNVDNLVNTIQSHLPTWDFPADQMAVLTFNRNKLQTLIPKCRSTTGSQADRTERNSLLKSTVGLCLLDVRIWAYWQYSYHLIEADDVHLLGFLLPGESGGHHSRTEATDVIAEVKVSIVNEDFIRVVIDQATGENAGPVLHGWPEGVKNALIVITAADGTTEVYRQFTTRLHNDIRMPDGSHGKQFIAKASFLKHVNDEPRFGSRPTFSMPLTTEDLVAALDRQHHEEFEAQIRETERQRQEIERLHAELNAKA
jgi:hypothetical protein